jgi:hypothetical protein
VQCVFCCFFVTFTVMFMFLLSFWYIESIVLPVAN